jgi:photosystem II stability/assembly factor-like uncharacterized protein
VAKKFVKVWLLATVVFNNFVTVGFLSAQTWTQTSAPTSLNWIGVASSADGSKLVAVAGDNGVYASSDLGNSWRQIFTNALVQSVALSADGNKLAIATFPNVFTSTNFGTTFMPTNWTFPFQYWWTVTLSADGSKLFATQGNSSSTSQIYISTNLGVTWTKTSAPTNLWISIACSADGSKLAAVGDGIYTSPDAGISWIKAVIPMRAWTSIASSADGIKLVAVAKANDTINNIFTSTNSGATWMQNDLRGGWGAVVLSADGNKIVVIGGPRIYTSTDFGITWTTNNISPMQRFYMASSSDGNKLVAAASYGAGIWTLQSITSPRLNITPLNDSLKLSWIIPSTNFVLQQNSDLSTANWMDINDIPTLNLTNLQEEVTLPATDGNNFYRLKTP